jgi:hypothetical protein
MFAAPSAVGEDATLATCLQHMVCIKMPPTSCMLDGKITELLKEMKKGYQSEADLFSYDGLQACLSEGVMVHQVNT